MTKSFILLASIILTSFSSFGQIQQLAEKSVEPEIPVLLIPRNSYRGCCVPIEQYYQSTGCSPKVIRKVEETQESLDITDPELAGFGASPNPTKGHLTISVPPSLFGYELQVMDMTGRFVGNAVPITGAIEHLNIEGESGIYLISIRTETNLITKRILLQN